MSASSTFIADPKLVRVYYEGDDDRNALEGLRGLGHLPDRWEIVKRDKQKGGKDGLVEELSPFVRPVNGVGGDAVVLVDLDDNSVEKLAEWFSGQLKTRTAGETTTAITVRRDDGQRCTLFTLAAGGLTGRAVLVPVGCCDHAELCARFGIDKFAMDDHIIQLVCDERVYSAVSEFEAVTYEMAMKKLTEVGDVLRTNGIAIRQTKRFIHILRAVAAVRPSTAAVIQRLCSVAAKSLSPDDIERIWSPLLSDLRHAESLLQPP